MRVLDLDLDFFLSAPCPFAEEGKRPADGCASPMKADAVRTFLEKNCGLSKDHPLPGRVFDTHDKALLFWNELRLEGRLTVPFTVTHVDAHTDLGIAQKGYPFVRHSVLTRPIEKRFDFDAFREQKQMNEANYLVFAIAARMVGRLENIRNPKSLTDFPAEMKSGENKIRLYTAFPSLFEAKNGIEPEVEYLCYEDYTCYRVREKFDFISLAISPRYTPKSADGLAEVIGEYMKEV